MEDKIMEKTVDVTEKVMKFGLSPEDWKNMRYFIAGGVTFFIAEEVVDRVIAPKTKKIFDKIKSKKTPVVETVAEEVIEIEE